MTAEFYIANRIRKATIKQNSPMASDRANPRMAYENSCCFRDGFLQTRTNCQCTYEKTKHAAEPYQGNFFIFSQRMSCENKPSIADNQAAEHSPDSSSGSSYSDCGSSSSDELGSGVDVPADGAGLEAPQCDLGEWALWHHSNTALEREKTKAVSFHL